MAGVQHFGKNTSAERHEHSATRRTTAADCGAVHETGCAVQQAITDGILAADRLASYQKLQKEVRYEGLDSKQIELEKFSTMFKDIGGMKKARKFLHDNDKRRR